MSRKENIKVLIIKSLIILFLLLLIFLLYYKYNYSKINPIFYLNGNEEVNLEVNTKYKEEGYVAKLNKHDLTKNVRVTSNINSKKVGTYEVHYTVYLKYLNVKKDLTRIVNVIDTTKPELKIDGDKEIFIHVDDTYTKPVVTANDNYDGDLTNNIKVFTNVDTSKSGVYEIKYSVKDSSDNETNDVIVVNVQEKEVPKVNKKEENNKQEQTVPVTNAYIDVIISQQRLNYYENGQLVLSSDVVTGINNGTPVGDYSILYKARNVTLKGSNYSSFVNYWMAFIGHSYGIHDASWRSSFGGEIYKYNGSHGCINMPYYNVSKLYDMVQVGTPVHVKY